MGRGGGMWAAPPMSPEEATRGLNSTIIINGWFWLFINVRISVTFSSFDISHVYRSANKAAHVCANKASSERRRCLWLNYTPPYLVSILEKDCNDVE